MIRSEKEETERSLLYRCAVAQLRGPLRVRAVGPFTQRLGWLSLLHGRIDALLSGRVASIQPEGRASRYVLLCIRTLVLVLV